MASSRLGQHFLKDPAIAQREIDYAGLTRDDIVLEIGPGKGALTRLLARAARQVIAVEIDPGLATQLAATLPDNVLLIRGNAVTLDFASLPRFTKVVANLPFWISSEFTIKLLDCPFDKAILIYQWEFAQRLAASPGSKHYGRLSVLIAYKAACRLLERVPRTSFDPTPAVDAAIVELIPRRQPEFSVRNEAFFFDIVRRLFTHRRKKIKTTLRAFTPDLDGLPFLDDRVEHLSPEQIGRLSDLLLEKTEKQPR